MDLVRALLNVVQALILPRSSLAAENLALRHQLAVLQRSVKRPWLRQRDRILWVWLSRLWSDWRSCLVIVKPETVIRWHNQGFRLYWRWKSRPKRVGRPKTDHEVRDLIRRMSIENPTCGVPRIRDELALLGIHVSEATIRKYRVRGKEPPSES